MARRLLLARRRLLARYLIWAGRLLLPRRLAALAAGVALRLPGTLWPARVGFIAIVSRMLAAWTAVATRIARTVTPDVAIAVAVAAIAVSIAVAAAAAAISIMPDVAMLRPVALRLRRCSRCFGRCARSGIPK